MDKFPSPEKTAASPLKTRHPETNGYPINSDSFPDGAKEDVYVAAAPGIAQDHMCLPKDQWSCAFELVDTREKPVKGMYPTTLVARFHANAGVDGKGVIADYFNNTDPDDAPFTLDEIPKAVCINCRRKARLALQDSASGAK